MDVRDVRMIEGRQRLGFAREPCEAISVVGERVRQDFERDLAIELRVTGAVHLTHATFADQRGHFIDAEAGARCKRQTAGL